MIDNYINLFLEKTPTLKILVEKLHKPSVVYVRKIIGFQDKLIKNQELSSLYMDSFMVMDIIIWLHVYECFLL